jgi:transcriptional regulator with XRE-family HTH domain
MKIKIGEKIKKLRNRDNMTQEQLAEKLGVTNQAVSKWESEGGYPDIEYIVSMADYFKVTTDYLLGHSTNLIDDINLPFADDESILGKWLSVKWIKKMPDVLPAFMNDLPAVQANDLYYLSVEFLPSGEQRSVMKDNFITAKWTKGLSLIDIGNGNTACAYDMHNFNGKEYLFIEWKSGDYTHRRDKPGYYIFIREA